VWAVARTRTGGPDTHTGSESQPGEAGYCSYTFFEQCPHRMACARCDFYTPKGKAMGERMAAGGVDHP
jgi:hypothetical protein